MSIFDINYINYVWNYLVPPAKRQPAWLSWGAAVMQGKQWWHNALFTTWACGSTDNAYSPTTAYSAGDRVIYPIQSDTATFTGSNAYYGDNGVYEALFSGFSGQPPTGTNVVPEAAPAWVVDSATSLTWLNTGNNGNPFYWVKVAANFIGANQRVSFSAQTLIFEYALNAWFGTTFRQPAIGTSDIYIVTNAVTKNRFYFHPSTSDSFFIPVTISSPHPGPSSNFFFPSGNFSPQYDFTIYIPVAVYNALINPSVEAVVTAPGTSVFRNGVVGNFAGLLCPAGILYNIITY